MVENRVKSEIPHSKPPKNGPLKTISEKKLLETIHEMYPDKKRMTVKDFLNATITAIVYIYHDTYGVPIRTSMKILKEYIEE